MRPIPKRSRKGKTASLHKSSSTSASLHKSSSTSASFVFSNIDLLSKILLCLPIKSIIVLKLVSKQWDSVISDSSFQKTVEKKCQLSHSGLFMPKSCKHSLIEFEYNLVSKDATSCVPFRTLAFGKYKQGVRIEQSCNGLILCSSLTPSTSCRVYYVYNPCTEQYKRIPRRCGFSVFASVSLAFDPSKSPYYKVINLWQRQVGSRIEIYSSQTSSLKNYGEKFQVLGRVPFSPGVYWNGSLNWMTHRGNLAYFDIDEEVIIKHLKVIDGETKMVRYFDVCRGHLQLIVQDNTGDSHFDVLEVETAHTGWNLKYRMDLESRLKVSYPELLGDGLKCKVMLYDEVDTEGEGSAKLLLLIQSPIGHGVISYDINNMQFKRIHNLGQPCIPEKCGLVYVCVHQYMGSLARV